ncbi:hypothetical protein GQ85_17625 [Rhodococcus rhodochrous]|nr:hypothetical protein GQ85_17625 [Rhodococcus rhodochrous]
MAYFFDALEFPDASRMTDLWNNTWADEAVGAEIATGHLVELGVDQHVDVESDFLNSHMPFHVAGFGGLYPDGRPWMFTMQTAPADLAVRLLGGADPHRILGDSLTRALDFNPEARLVDALAWTRRDLVEVYAEEGIGPGAVDRWSVADLLRGLLAQCTSVPLADIVSGYPGCAFPDVAHACAADVFGDAYAAWGRRQ